MDQENIMFMPVTDPNPSEMAECSLTLLSRPMQQINGDLIGAELVELYDHNASFSLVCKILHELELNDSSMVYVGTREKCHKWSEIFKQMDIESIVEDI